MTDILNVNTVLLKSLKEKYVKIGITPTRDSWLLIGILICFRFRHWSERQQIGDIILTLAPFMKMYKQYTENYETVVRKLIVASEIT